MTPFQYDLKKKKALNVNFYLDVIDYKQTLILSGKHCQALDLGQQVHKIDVNFKELLDQHPSVQNTSGTSSIEIDPTATPVVHGPRRRPAACSSYEKFSISVLTLSFPRSHQWFSLLSAINFYDVSLENLVVDRLKIPWSLCFFILISCLLDNALTL